MKKIFLVLAVAVSIIYACTQTTSEVKETITKGVTKIYVDETLLPIVQEQKEVFESIYKYAELDLIAKPETELVNDLMKLDARILIIPRELTPAEVTSLREKSYIGKTTPLATDAIAAIVNVSDAYEKITTQEIYDILQGKSSKKQLVFDNANSSTLNYLMQKAGVKNLPKTGVTALKNTNEVITFVAENKNYVGFVGVNWMLSPNAEIEQTIKSVKVLAVGNSAEKAVKPTQTAIYTGEYPFTRKIFMLNYQGKAGLGMGFASFVAGDVGQRIILKSGLLPNKIPTRELRIRKEL